MAAFNPKHLTNPDIVRTIETKRLLALLKPYADYLRGRGLSLPSARQAATLDLELLAEILETPDEAAPQDLLNAIGYIDEMAVTMTEGNRPSPRRSSQSHTGLNKKLNSTAIVKGTNNPLPR
ncbi:hypothetical protein SV7mr_30450 [Stieleria bergensis]|uniref:Uncharacterized protein n=1 Tax=Stieleria bergensis TaxID=2528025 RepID=A0A517SWK7_9BACT|nr:hypothetical protein SV7mr_30450 [Planctomycetes bacterium SV_7m_r]